MSTHASQLKTIVVGNECVEYDAVVNLMDDDVRERLHAEGYDTPQPFADAYFEADPSLRELIVSGQW